MAPTDKTAKLHDFFTWVGGHIKGDEKGEAQLFLDRLFQAFGWPGLREAGATCEERIKNDGGGTSFADLVWKPVVLIEMKKRGSDLRKHYSQAFTYWTRLVPNRPRYAVLCNFDEFWIYDFDVQLDTPVDTVNLADLPNKFGPLNFLFPGDVAPIFGNHQEAVTRKAADKMAALIRHMTKRGIDRNLAQRFSLQTLVALFAEDIGLLEKYFFTQLLNECKTPQDSYDLIGGLFEAMNTKGGVRGGRFKGVDYFNGGLFTVPARVELDAEERTLLKEASEADWSKVRPEIFGTIFESSLDKSERHAYGAHYTSPVDIMKIVGPTIVEPWTTLIESADTLAKLKTLLARIETFTVLDPACGSGNFLYTAYRELKRLEARIYERMATEYRSVDPQQRPFGFLTTRNFYGMDINGFAVDLAKVTMMLAHKLSIDELHMNEQALPLDNLDGNFRIGDALITPENARAPWFKTDVIIGNPPFLGSKLMKKELGTDYIKRVRKVYPEIPGNADLCVYWIRRAQDELSACTLEDPVIGRAGLVGTQNIRNNASRIGGLDYVSANATLVEAVESQPWSGEANVNVSIANWIKSKDSKVLPKQNRLWFKVASPQKTKRPRGSGSATKQYSLDMREVAYISSSLSDKYDVSGASTLACNIERQYVFQGQTPGHKGFILTPKMRADMVAANAKLADVTHSFVGGDQVLKATALPHRFVIDFEQLSVVEAAKFPAAFDRVKVMVLPTREAAFEKGKDKDGKPRSHHEQFLSRWWQLSWGRADLLEAIGPLKRYLVCSRVTKRPLFAFLDGDLRPGDSLQIFAFEDDYSYGILQAVPHQAWFVAKSSKLTERLRYTPESVFETFPWPQSPTATQIRAVADAGKALRDFQRNSMKGVKGGLRALYKTFELPGKSPLKDAHAALDATVLDAYGFSSKKDILKQIFDLNQDVVAKIQAGKTVLPPGIPAGIKAPASLVSDDCIGR